MKHKIPFLLGLLLLALSAPLPSAAHDDHTATLAIETAWARETGVRTSTAAVYMTINNLSHNAITISGASSPAAERVEIHRSFSEEGIMRMERYRLVTINGEKSFEFAPGSYHIMLFDLAKPLKKGDLFPLTLELTQGDPVQVYVSVTGIEGLTE